MKSNKCLVVTFLIIIYGILIMIPINYVLEKKDIVSIDNDILLDLKKEDGNIVDRTLTKIDNTKKKIERITSIYFPFYDEILYNDTKLNIFLDRNLYKIADKNDIPLGTNYNGEYVHKDVNNNSYYLFSQYNKDELQVKVDNQIKMFNSFTKLNSEVYIYMTSYYGYFNIDNTIRNMSDYIKYFEDNIDSKINIINSDINIDNFYTYYYKTDHHWNAYGVKKAYGEILNTMDIKPESLNVINTNILMRGANAKKAADLSGSEYFNYIDYDNTCDASVGSNNFKPLRIKESSKPFYDYYVSFYYDNGNNLYSFDCKNKKEKLLILGDSFVWSIDYLIAPNFNKTYIVNNKINEFDLKKFVEENDIDKILIINDLPTTLFDQVGFNMLDKFEV